MNAKGILLMVTALLLLVSGCQPVQRLPANTAETGAGTPGTMTIFAKGGPLESANGAMFGPDGNLYVASAGGSEIIAIDPDTGKFVKRYTSDQGVATPDDITFGPDGSLYWTGLMGGEVGRLTPDGVKSGQMVAPGVNPITFSDDGRLFVALDFMGDGLYELDPELKQPPRLLIKELGFLNAMDFGPDKLLYGPIYTQGRIVCIDVDAEPPTVETVIDGLKVPAAVKFDGQGRLYALDSGTGEVWRVDTAGGEKELLATLRPGIDNLAFDPSDRLFVTDNNSGYIWEVLPNQNTREIVHGGMIGPEGIAVLPGTDGEIVYTGNVFSIYAFDGATGAVKLDGTPASAVTIAPFGDKLVTASWFSNAVTLVDPKTGAELAAYHDFAVPLNAVEFQGDLVVAELGTSSLVRASGDDMAQRTTIAEGLTAPVGLATSAGDLWVSDMATGTVWQIAAGGEILAEPQMVAQGLAAPSGLALAPDGSLLVVEAGTGRLLSVDLETGETAVVAEGLAVPGGQVGMAPTLSGVAVGPSGAIYAASGGENALYKIAAD